MNGCASLAENVSQPLRGVQKEIAFPKHKRSEAIPTQGAPGARVSVLEARSPYAYRQQRPANKSGKSVD